MGDVIINVRTPGARWPNSSGPMDLRVAGAYTDVLLESVEKAEREAAGPDATLWDLYGVEWDDPEYPLRLHQRIPDGLTLAQAREFFGEEADSWPPTIRVTEGGYGGDAEPLSYVLEFARDAAAIFGFVKGALAVQRQAMHLQFAHQRRLAKDWNDSGLISQELKDAVYNGSPWQRKAFDQTFDLGPSRGPDLLRALGFEKRTFDQGGEAWRYDFEREDHVSD